jgi:SAM-dependent methyltransferase
VFGDAGYDVLGVDQSADLLAIARRRAPAARFVHASLHDVELPPCAAVVAMGEIFNYARIGDELFARVRAALRPGGLFVFDAAAPGRGSADPVRSWFEGDGWVVCVDTREDAEARRLTRRIATFRSADGGSWARSDEEHVLTLYWPDAVVADLTAAGFEDARVLAEGYGPELELPPGLPVYAARAPAAG